MAEQGLEDESRSRIVRETALSLGKWLEGAKLLEKKIWQLRLEDLEKIVDVSISTFIVAESREQERRRGETIHDARNILA